MIVMDQSRASIRLSAPGAERLMDSAIPAEPLDGAVKPNGHDRPTHARVK
jgi:hypothetical protein